MRFWARVIVALTSSIVFGPSFPSSFFIASKTNFSLFCRNFFSSSHNSTLYRISVGAVLQTRKLFSFDISRCYSVARRVLYLFFLNSSTRILYCLSRRKENTVNSLSTLRELILAVQNTIENNLLIFRIHLTKVG